MQVQNERVSFVWDVIASVLLLEGNASHDADTLDPQSFADGESRFLDVDGVTLHYKECGSSTPGAPAILLIHGWNGSLVHW
jgi:hypothetical protein